MAGHLVRVLVDEHLVTGRYEEAWDGRNDAGHKISSGVYFYRLTAAEYEQTKKMVLLRYHFKRIDIFNQAFGVSHEGQSFEPSPTLCQSDPSPLPKAAEKLYI
ncbi:MAG: hypothetical protein JW876_08295 [Candidatus Krumholzibacteriota bacterium]|nr:hypothetical protein [Candidatus Krumholzibacteriota bacterium]